MEAKVEASALLKLLLQNPQAEQWASQNVGWVEPTEEGQDGECAYVIALPQCCFDTHTICVYAYVKIVINNNNNNNNNSNCQQRVKCCLNCDEPTRLSLCSWSYPLYRRHLYVFDPRSLRLGGDPLRP